MYLRSAPVKHFSNGTRHRRRRKLGERSFTRGLSLRHCTITPRYRIVTPSRFFRSTRTASPVMIDLIPAALSTKLPTGFSSVRIACGRPALSSSERPKRSPAVANGRSIQLPAPSTLRMRLSSVPLPLLPRSLKNHSDLSHATFGRITAPMAFHSRSTTSGSSDSDSIQLSTSQSVPSSSLWMTGFCASGLNGVAVLDVKMCSGLNGDSSPVR